MTTAHRLPNALAPWAEALEVLDAEVAIALGPIIARLDRLVARRESGAASEGELDGYDGISRRGVPERLLMSEWALAEVVPDEFLRRAVSGELLHLQPAWRSTQLRGRLAVLVDTGPEQLGAARLVQLASLIVLHRHAARRGSELLVGILGDEPGQWRSGPVESLLRGWLTARRAQPPNAADVAGWLESLEVTDQPDEVWTLTGPRLASSIDQPGRVLVSQEAAWDDEGATQVEVRLDGARLELALPRPEVSIRVLRGAAFRTAASLVTADATEVLRGAIFPSAARRLLARGRGPSELVAITVRTDGAGRPRRMTFSGPVLAATFVGKRTVAVVEVDGFIRVEIVGKALANLQGFEAPATLFVDGSPEAEIAPLHFSAAHLLARLNGQWWRFTNDTVREEPSIVAVHVGPTNDQPRLALQKEGFTFIPGYPSLLDAGQVELGPDVFATSQDGHSWRFPDGEVIAVDDGIEILGVRRLDGQNAIITRSSGGLIISVLTASATRTLTPWSGGAGPPTLHPVEPWIVVTREANRIEIGHLITGELIATIQGAP